MLRRVAGLHCVCYIGKKDCMARFATGVNQVNTCRHRESTLRVAHQCTVPPVWLVPKGVYLIIFLIGNLSYIPCSEPSRTVLFLDQMYTMYARHPS